MWDSQKRVQIRGNFLPPLLSNCSSHVLAPVALATLHTTIEIEYGGECQVIKKHPKSLMMKLKNLARRHTDGGRRARGCPVAMGWVLRR